MRYGIGDIVKLNDSKNSMEYFIVVDVFLEFVDGASPFSLKVDDELTRYTVMQMYPVTKEKNMLLRFTADKFETVAFIGQQQHEKIVELINRERFRRGQVGAPFYEEVIQKRLRNDNFDAFVSNTTKNQKGKKKKIKITDDIIQYNKLDTVDECLDAMNDLSNLHKTFGDESYLQLREVVVGRLKDLTDIAKKAKSKKFK